MGWWGVWMLPAVCCCLMGCVVFQTLAVKQGHESSVTAWRYLCLLFCFYGFAAKLSACAEIVRPYNVVILRFPLNFRCPSEVKQLEGFHHTMLEAIRLQHFMPSHSESCSGKNWLGWCRSLRPQGLTWKLKISPSVFLRGHVSFQGKV